MPSLFRMPLTGLRFFTVYGPWGRPDMAMWIFTKALYAGEPMPLFNGGEMRRDFTYIDDIVTRRDRLPRCPARGRRLGQGRRQHRPHAHLQYRQQPQRRSDAGRRAARTSDRQESPARPAADADRRRQGTFADISAIERDLGFEPATTIDEGIPRFVDWYREYHGV